MFNQFQRSIMADWDADEFEPEDLGKKAPVVRYG